jgi:GDP-D-mannose dehydratase
MILITGGAGQIGSLLKLELLKYYNPKLIILAVKSDFKCRYDCKVVTGDLQNLDFVRDIFIKNSITKVFNLATASFVDRNLIWEDYLDYNRCKIFDNITQVISENNKNIWLFHPLSSEIFGVPDDISQGNQTKISPINSYGIQKSTELLKCRFLNSQGFNLFHPILFNTESKFRSKKFFTRRIIEGLINYKKTGKGNLKFYNSYSSRDFSYGPDSVNLFYKSMCLELKGDECFGSSYSLTILKFIELSLNELKIDYKISNQHGLIKIIDNDLNVIAYEGDRDLTDQKRKFKFDGIFNNKCFETDNIRGGKVFLKCLINDYINNNDE